MEGDEDYLTTLAKTLKSSLTDFSKLTSDIDLVNFASREINKFESTNNDVTFKKDEKSDAVSCRYRELGNAEFKKGKYMEAHSLYTESIATAKTSEVLALAYGNRSAVLYKLGLHQECLTDIERAFSHGYPKNLSPKLASRRENSKKSLKPPAPYYAKIPEIKRKNEFIQAAADCVRIKNSKNYGNHVVATRDIKIGEILGIDIPYAVSLLNEDSLHCDSCTELCYNLIPCDNCTFALFCGDKCRKTCHDKYHKYECPLLLSLKRLFQDLDKKHLLALRMTFQAKINPSNDSSYRSDRFREIQNLTSHRDTYDNETLFNLALLTAKICDLVEKNTEFPVDDEFKTTLFLNFQISNINKTLLGELVWSEGEFKSAAIACGLYSFHSLFNHSCFHNTSHYNYGSTMVLRACTSIKKGEQCFIGYGPYYDIYSKKERRDILRRKYHFECKCRACEENWGQDKDEFRFDRTLTFMTFKEGISRGDTKIAEKLLPQLYSYLEEIEKCAPCFDVSCIQQMMLDCYRLQASKRLV